jgi:hypothetical protein
MESVANMIRLVFIVCLILSLSTWPAAGDTPLPPTAPLGPEMPDESHRLLAGHAALSHGLAGPLAGWIAQGAYDEDHCQMEPYPPCEAWIPNGWHSWDPDTGQYWTKPFFWWDFGSGLTRADQLLSRALDASASGDAQTAYLYLGRTIHMLGDMATPAHVHLDTHLPPFDSDPYEVWLNQGNLANTRVWIDAQPAGPVWDLDFHHLPDWAELGMDLQVQLEAASQIYGGRASGQELWQLGPEGHDAVLFRLMFLMAELADDYDSGDVAGEQHHGDLGDTAYLTQMRDVLFPKLVSYGAALIDYFEGRSRSCPGCIVFLPAMQR